MICINMFCFFFELFTMLTVCHNNVECFTILNLEFHKFSSAFINKTKYLEISERFLLLLQCRVTDSLHTQGGGIQFFNQIRRLCGFVKVSRWVMAGPDRRQIGAISG